MFNDIANPSADEVRGWAYSAAERPDSDWELYLSWTREFDMFVEFALDDKCPIQSYFKQMLYYLVGYGWRPCD